MPANPRDKIKKKMAGALNGNEKCTKHLIDLYEFFAQDHELEAEGLALLVENALALQEAIYTFWEATQGPRPKDYRRYL